MRCPSGVRIGSAESCIRVRMESQEQFVVRRLSERESHVRSWEEWDRILRPELYVDDVIPWPKIVLGGGTVHSAEGNWEERESDGFRKAG